MNRKFLITAMSGKKAAWDATRSWLAAAIRSRDGIPSVMSSPPTVTFPESSTISGPTTLVEDAATRHLLGGDFYKYPYDGTNWAIANCVNYTADGSNPTEMGMGVEFQTNAQDVEVPGVSFPLFRPWVDDQLVQSDPIVGASGALIVHIHFASVASRKIRIDLPSSARWDGIKVPTGATVAAPTNNPITMCVVGDSFVEGTGSSFGGVSPYGLLGVPNYLGMYLGVDNTRCSGSGGTGWNHVSGGRCNILDRNQLDVVATHPDVVVYAAGTNDADNPAQAAANCASALTQTRASLPAAMIYVIGPWDGQAPAAMDAGLAAVRDALKSAAAGRGGVKFLDTTGVAFTKCGDMTHPDLVGHQTLALWVNKQVRTDLGVIDQIYDDFSWHADGTPTYLITGQPWVQVPLHDGGGDLTTVVASISGGMLVASDSGQDRTASYTGVDCGTPPQSMYATVSFTAGAAGGGVCLLTNKIGLDRNEYIGQGGALHIVYGPWSTTVGYFDVVHGFVIIDVPQYYPIETGKVVQLGWRISGDTTYVLTPDGVERTYTDPNMISNNGRYAMFETYWGAGQSQGQFHTVSVNKPLSAPAASSLMSIGRSYDIDAVTAQSITVPRGGVPSGSLIVVIVDAGQSNIPINGAVSDPHNASYIAIDGQYNWGNQTYGYGRIYYCYNSAALSSGDLITLTLPQAAAHLKMSAFYWTDAETASDPRDYAVTATTTGISSANPLFSLTSGIPSKAGDLMLGVVTTSPNSGGAAGNWYGQDTAHGWSGPPPLESGYLPPYSCFAEIDGGTQINAGTGAVTFSPGNPAEQSNLTYAAWVVGFKAK